MSPLISFTIYNSADELPDNWDTLSNSTIFLTKDYLKSLEVSSPENMTCFFIGIFKAENLVGIALSQFLDLSSVESFGDRDNCIKTKIRNIVFKNFNSKVLFIGNNMLTGQNAFHFSDTITVKEGLQIISDAAAEIRKSLKLKGIATHLIVWKDFSNKRAQSFQIQQFKDYYKFSTQPNMIFPIRENWISFEHYLADLSKKYRDQYKRARKKAESITKRKLALDEIIHFNPVINNLYLTVAENAPFNTFYLPINHFIDLKTILTDQFLFYGYFENDTLIGFNTLIKNGADIDTYFLGYDENFQRSKMIYLNMLYDMVAYSINKGYKRIIFARTALEIKSSVGAKPENMFGFIKHTNPIINLFMPKLFRYFEPENVWKERHPFKD